MARWRVAVAIVVPPPLAGELDVLRRALGVGDADDVVPHLTLVPPLNLRERDVPAALAVLRAAAADEEPFVVPLGPLASFEPVSPTIHLAVGADPVASAGAGRVAVLQRALARPPLERRVDHPFVPHVTLVQRAPLHQIRAARLALRGYRGELPVEGLTLLRETRRAAEAGQGIDEAAAGRRRRWRAVADVELGGVRVVGRGGLPLELTTGTVLDPESEAALGLAGLKPAGPVVVVARREGAVVGAAWGVDSGDRQAPDDDVGHLLAAEWAFQVGRSRHRQGVSP